MHLVDEQVSGVGQPGQVVVGRVPHVSSRVAVALGEDVLCGGAGSANGIDGGLIEVQDEVLVHVVVLVVGVEDDIVVVREGRRHRGPEAAESIDIFNYVTVVATKVVSVGTKISIIRLKDFIIIEGGGYVELARSDNVSTGNSHFRHRPRGE